MKGKIKKTKKKTKQDKKKQEPKKYKSLKAPKPSPKKIKTRDRRQKRGAPLKKLPAKKPEAKPSSVKKPDRRDEIKNMLLQMRKELLEDVSKAIKTESDYLRFDIGDFYDYASSDRDRELALTLTDREREKLILIDDALRKIEDGSYGVCESCGDEIGEDRLRVMPFAKLCLSCKIDLEGQQSRNI